MSQHNSQFPVSRSGLNYALSTEPLLLNGMKVLFDQSASVYPVNLQLKDSTNRGISIKERFSEQKSYYAQPFGGSDKSPSSSKPAPPTLMTSRERSQATIARGVILPTTTPTSRDSATASRIISTPDADFFDSAPHTPISAPKFGVGGKIVAYNPLTSEEGSLFNKEYNDFLEENKEFLITYPDYLNFLKEAWKYKERFQNDATGLLNGKDSEVQEYVDEEPKDDPEIEDTIPLNEQSENLFRSLYTFINTSSVSLKKGNPPSVSDRIRIEELMRALREADKFEGSEEFKKELGEYDNKTKEIEAVWGKIVNLEQFGSGPKTLLAENIFKSYGGGIASLDPSGISPIVIEAGKSAKSIYSTLKHRSNLKYLLEAEKSPHTWKAITEFIVKQKSLKIGTKTTKAVGTLIPGAGMTISLALAAHNRDTSAQRIVYAKQLIVEFMKGNWHAGLIILELVGERKIRVVTTLKDEKPTKQGISILAAKMAAG